MTLLLSALLSASVAGFGMLVFAVYRAPEGYEDEMGFHRLH